MKFKRRGAPADWRLLLMSGAAFCATGAASVPDPQPAAPPVQEVAAMAPVPASRWKPAAVRDLIAAIEASDSEGLNPDDYDLASLKSGLAEGESPALDAIAQRAALTLAHDYQYGRVGDRVDLGWHIDRGAGTVDPIVLNAAVERGKVRHYLESLLPIDARYEALRTALADSPEGAARDRIRANMERWRWMPRDLGREYLYVNVPSYTLQRIDDGAVRSTYTVVVGAKDTPTPWIAGDAPSLVVNPWWNVPPSIIRSSNMRPGKAGYVFKASANGYIVRQPPGPRNALGRLKINLTNDQAIYLHDTPSKAGFAKDDRALSHGCIRVKDIDQLAAELMSDGDGARLDAALAQGDTRTLQLPKPYNVYLVYFTLDRGENGDLVSYGDPYGRDAEVIARLDGRPLRGIQIAQN